MSTVYTRFQFLRYLIKQKIYWLKAYCLNSRSFLHYRWNVASLTASAPRSVVRRRLQRELCLSPCAGLYIELSSRSASAAVYAACCASNSRRRCRDATTHIRHAHRLRSHSSVIMYISPARHRYLKCCTRYAAKQLVSKRHSISNRRLQCVLGGKYQSR